MRLGVELGRAGTDAVLVDVRDHLLAKAKAAMTADPRAGVGAAIRTILSQAAVDPRRVTRAVLGTTQAMEAVLDRRDFLRVAVIRIGGPLTHAAPPLVTWPRELRDAVSVGDTVVEGGADIAGRPVTPLDGEAMARFLAGVASTVDSVAITGVFSPVAPDHELAAAETVRAELGAGVPVSLSHQVGSLGLLERENATVLNAALCRAAQRFADSFRAALEAEGIDAEPFFAQNDGSVMALEHALRFPVLMIGSGPASSMRGAAYLSGVDEAVVVDVRPSSADVGVLAHGFPRESTHPTDVRGVRVNFRMPDILSIAAGAASAFGAKLAGAVEHVKGRTGSPLLVVVGGAGASVPDRVDGVSEVLRPADGDVANAIGTVIAPVSGQAERICANRPDHRRRAVEEARRAAFEQAVHAGADPAAIEVVEVEEIPLAYMLDPAIRIRVKAVGPQA